MRINVKLASQSIKDTLCFDGKTMVNINISYPKAEGILPTFSARTFNRYNLSKAEQLVKYARTQLYKAAVEQYKYAKQNGFPFNPYELMQVFKETYNRGRLVSLYRDVYEYTGGAHGMTSRYGQTWDMEKGCMLSMANLFRPGYNYRRIILTEILRQANYNHKTGKEVYFDNYEGLIVQYFDAGNYYLTAKGVAVFYPLYSISPYSSGIQVFVVPYELFGKAFNPKC